MSGNDVCENTGVVTVLDDDDELLEEDGHRLLDAGEYVREGDMPEPREVDREGAEDSSDAAELERR